MNLWKYLFVSFLFMTLAAGQPIIEENFIYPPGILTILNPEWVEDPVGSNDVQVIEGNLLYPGYPSSGTGNMIFLDGGASGRAGIRRSYPLISGEGKKIFISFLLSLKDTLDLNAAGFFRLKAVDTSIKLYLYIQKITGLNKFKIGISKGGEVFYDQVLRSPGETYLVVASYKFCTGYDSLKLWINPDLSGTIPNPNINICPAVVDAAGFNSLNIVQVLSSGNSYIDGIRLDTTWAQSPLPVELTLFTAELHQDKIIVKWRTETEVDNYGFELQKKVNDNWSCICFLTGFGNSNIPHEYHFEDRDIFEGNSISYRLKQVDTDGGYKFSNEIDVRTIADDSYLYQNYPNPFNPSTTIRYSIADNSFVSIGIYNIIGQQVASLVNTTQQPGNYSITFDALRYNLSNGVYIYKLRTDKFTTNRKMILMR